MTLSTTDIAAYLGAAAWAPQLFRLGYDLFTKPIITIIPDKTVEIGYTTFGPVFNLRLSINVDKKNTLIDHINVSLHHQDGSEHSFEWAGMTEVFSEIKNSHGDNQIIQRNNTPILIKLNTLSLTERFFRFLDDNFLIANKPMIDKLSEQQLYLKKKNINYHDAFLSSKEFESYLKFMRERFGGKQAFIECLLKYVLHRK